MRRQEAGIRSSRGKGSRRLRVAGLLALGLLGAGEARAQFTVSPGSLSMEAVDSASSAVIYVRNDGDRDLQFRFYLGDFEQQESGDYEFLPAGSTPQSCASRVRVFPEGAVIAPGAQEAVRVRMEPGSGSCWGMVFVETAPEGDGPVRIAKRVATKVFAVLPGSEPAGEIAEVVVRDTADRRLARVHFRNTGDVPLIATGHLEIRALDGKVVDRVEIERFSVLPRHSRALGVPLAKRLAAGRYLAVPVLDFGAEYVAGGQAAFTVQ